MDQLFVIGLAVGIFASLWLFLGYWSYATIARYFVNRYSPVLGQKAWDKDAKLEGILFTFFGLLTLCAALQTLRKWGKLGNLLNPLWTWPFWTYRETN